MEIIRSPIIEGITPTLLNGTDRYVYGLSDFEDGWNLKDLQEHGGYQGAVLYLYDLYENKLYKPYEQKRNVLYQMSLFYDNIIYFLQTDYDDKNVNLYCVSPTVELKKIIEFSIDEVNLYNIGLAGDGGHVTSQDESLICYYPNQFEIPLESNEGVICIAEDKIYIDASIEEGIVNDELTNDYRHYEKLIIKDKKEM